MKTTLKNMLWAEIGRNQAKTPGLHLPQWMPGAIKECGVLSNPLLSDVWGASWLTVGDGRYGTDAHYIFSKGVRNVLATDISDYLLREE